MMTSQATKDLKATVADNIRTARRAQGWTQRELAARVNEVDSMAVSRWERGTSIPNPTNMAALADALSVDPGWLYTDHERTAA